MENIWIVMLLVYCMGVAYVYAKIKDKDDDSLSDFTSSVVVAAFWPLITSVMYIVKLIYKIRG